MGSAAGVLAALYLVAVFGVVRVPDGALSLFGGATDLLWLDRRIAHGVEPAARLRRAAAALAAAVRMARLAIGDGVATLDVAYVAPENVTEVARRLATQPFELREVLETDETKHLPRVVQLPMIPAVAGRLRARRVASETGLLRPQHTHSGSARRPQRDRAAKLAEAAAAGWELPPRSAHRAT